MFSQLVTVLFPKLGEFFGYVTGLANAPFVDTWNYLLGLVGFSDVNVSITCCNLFDGSVNILVSTVPDFRSFFNLGVSKLLNWLFSIIVPDSVVSLPFWIGLLFMVVTTLLAVAVFRFALSFVRG